MKAIESNQRQERRKGRAEEEEEEEAHRASVTLCQWQSQLSDGANAAAVQVPLKDVRSHRQIARGGFEAGARPGGAGGNCICRLLQDPDKSRFVLRTQ